MIEAVILQAVLIFINAIFASAEIAVISMNETKLKHMVQEGNKKAGKLSALTEQPAKFLSTIQVAITLAGLLGGAFAADHFADPLIGKLRELGVALPEQVLRSIVVLVITLILTYFSLVFGELVPKRIAMKKTEKLALGMSGLLYGVSVAFAPLVWLLTASTNLVLRLMGINPNEEEVVVTEEDIRMMLAEGNEQGTIQEEESWMIKNIFEFDDSLALNVMTPRTDVYCIDINDALSDNIDQMMTMQYTRIPVYDDSIDNIIGILNMKDFAIEARKVGFDNVDIKKLLRKPYFVLETKNIDDLFRELQKEHQHIAILVDEYGGFSGIITVEDLIEEIMGDIEDEYDHDDEPKLKKIDNNNYIVDGNYLLDDLDDELDLKLSNNNHDTIGGFVLHLLGEIPEENQQRTVKYENLTFLIIGVKGNRVTKIKLTINEKEKEPDFSED